MGKTILYDKVQEVVIGAFGKDSSGLSADDVMARIDELTTDDVVTNADNDNNDKDDNTVDNDTNDNVDDVDNNDNVDNPDTNVDDVVIDDNNDNNDDSDDIVDNTITLSEEFKTKFGLEEFNEDKILDKIKTLEEEKTALILEKEKIQRDSFMKEKGITSEVFEALSGNTLKEKEQALKKVSTLTGFKLNSSKDVKTSEIKFDSSF